MSEEKFREWNPHGMIRVHYKDANGEKKLWTYDQKELLEKMKKILNEYAEQDIKLTNRQLYYQLVANGIIPNALEIYKRICVFLTDARYGGEIDWDAIEDRGRVPEIHAEWSNIKSLVSSALYSYRLPRWQDQDNYVELYCEKQALESVLKPIADKYHIFFGYNKGYSSASTMYDLANRLRCQIEKGKYCIVLYLGDHDPSGIDMVRDVRDRINEFLVGGDNEVEPNFKVQSIALTKEQINKYNPPPNPAKITDPRAKGYISIHGEVSWELDALKPEILMKIASSGILEYIDLPKYEAWIKRENEEKEALGRFGDSLSNGTRQR